MSTPLIFRRLAQAEFDDAADWYEGKRTGRGMAFASAVRRTLNAISANPVAFPEASVGVREAVVSGYPYSVFYRIDPGQITVLAVFHHSRDPAAWRSRS